MKAAGGSGGGRAMGGADGTSASCTLLSSTPKPGPLCVKCRASSLELMSFSRTRYDSLPRLPRTRQEGT